MRDLLDQAPGERMALDPYWEDFNKHFWRVGEPGFRKLERQQTFQELNNDSWDAFVRGEWDEALRLMEAQRPHLTETSRKIAEHGLSVWWVRVVEKPISPYLQWELNWLMMRGQCGDKIRIVGLDQVERFEEHGLLPEIVTLGTDVMYEICYDENGLQQGGIRFEDRDLTIRCQKFIEDLYAAGEEIESFFQREVAGLEPPRGQ